MDKGRIRQGEVVDAVEKGFQPSGFDKDEGYVCTRKTSQRPSSYVVFLSA